MDSRELTNILLILILIALLIPVVRR